MPALFMRLSFWKLLIVVGIVLFFFWPLFAKLACIYLERRRNRESKASRLPRRPSKKVESISGRCPHCGAKTLDDAEFCHRCGRRIGVIDV